MARDAYTGLVLTGGGARGAYQAGALLAIAEITNARHLPFDVLAGASAGSLSVAYLASRAHDFAGATRSLADLWTTLTPSRVFRTDAATLVKSAGAWGTDLGLGGFVGTVPGKALLDTTPLRELVVASLDEEALRRHVTRGDLRGLAVTATSYATGLAVTFVDGARSISPWTRATRVGVRAEIGVDHVIASSAIPIFFPATRVGGSFYADGCIRLSTPLSPAIHMGARRIVAIAVRHASTASEPATRSGPIDAAPADAPASLPSPPSTAETAGILLNALFLDALESDIERTTRINETLSLLSPEARASRRTPLEHVDVLMLRPSVDLASLVLTIVDRFPVTVRHLLRGLGASETEGWDLLSYLAFDGVFTTRLFDLGYDDTIARADELRRFFA